MSETRFDPERARRADCDFPDENGRWYQAACVDAEDYDQLLELYRKQQAHLDAIRWISIKNRLPPTIVNGKYGPQSMPVLCSYGSNIFVAALNCPKEYEPWWMNSNEMEVCVTLWMPLPDPSNFAK